MAGLPPERISRFLTYLLRHQPKEYPLVFDKRGFVDWQDVVKLVQERYYDVTEEQVEAVVSGSEKKRFELVEDKVRATYGHSFAVELGDAAQQAPEKLYYGAARDLAQSMLRSGLKPRDRQYVHLSLSAEEAASVARRHDPAPSLIEIDAAAAQRDGVRFYLSGPLYLAEFIPAKFLSLL
jgi:putative RNA 2'-phosphotransferase